LNPRLVYCSISAFGPDGPYRDFPGYDTIGQAMGGLLSVVTDLHDPKPTGISFSDHLTGIFACYGILVALMARERTDEGQLVETSLLQATTSFVQEPVTRYLATGEVPRRETRVMSAQVYAFVAGDGKPFVIHLSTPPKFWRGLTHAAGRPELAEDPRFLDKQDRRKNYPALHALLAEVFRARPRDEWIAALRACDVPCAPLYTVDEVVADPQVRHLGMPHQQQHATAGTVSFTGSAIALSATPVDYRLASPLLGEHTEDVLQELGFDNTAIAALHAEGVI
jgi:crotonobetainyl-CoA:carnitine CoA-transferase CaiB-like acyl-CoA transferase